MSRQFPPRRSAEKSSDRAGAPGDKPTPEQFARGQRERLQAAMIEVVAERGYAATSVQDLAASAGVSNSTFYGNFRNKQECFFSTFDAIVEWVSAEIAAAAREPGDFRRQFTAGLSTFAEIVAENPEALTLVIVDSLTLGATGMEYRERASEGFAAMLERSLRDDPRRSEASPMVARAILAGIRCIARLHLQAGDHRQFPAVVDDLAEWALSYREPAGELLRRAAAAAADPAPRRTGEATDA